MRTQPISGARSSAPAEGTRGPDVTAFRDPKDGETLKVREGNDLKLTLSHASGSWKVLSTDRSFGQPRVTSGAGCTEMSWKTKSPIGSLVGSHRVQVALVDPAAPASPSKVLNLTVAVAAAGRAETAVGRLDPAAMIAMCEKSKTINHGWHTVDGFGASSPPPPNFSAGDRKEMPFVVWSDNGRPGGDYQAFLKANPQWPDFVNTAMGTLA